MKEGISQKSFYRGSQMYFSNVESQSFFFIAFYIFQSKVLPSIFSSQIFLNKSKLYLG